jgi:hypothetical protein
MATITPAGREKGSTGWAGSWTRLAGGFNVLHTRICPKVWRRSKVARTGSYLQVSMDKAMFQLILIQDEAGHLVEGCLGGKATASLLVRL